MFTIIANVKIIHMNLHMNYMWVFCRYLVFSDPPGVRIGSGGATMHALEQLQAAIPMEELIRCMLNYIMYIDFVTYLSKSFFVVS